jgi:uncharacterized protein YaeQ
VRATFGAPSGTGGRSWCRGCRCARTDSGGRRRRGVLRCPAELSLALTTLHHFEIALSDTDRGVYEALDLRAAQHPSETMRYLLTRTIALCLLWEDGIAFSRGLSTTEEPAVWSREPDGRVRLWVEIGHPSAERLHKASKAAARVAVCTHDARALQRGVQGERIHRGDQVEVLVLPTSLLDGLESVTGRHARWDLVHTGGQIYVTTGDRTFEGAVERPSLFEA